MHAYSNINTSISKVNNDGDDVWLLKGINYGGIICKIILGTERRKSCMITPTENTVIS